MKSGALRVKVSRSQHSWTIATSGLSAVNAAILRWNPDPQFQDTIRTIAAVVRTAQPAIFDGVYNQSGFSTDSDRAGHQSIV
jgi:hypothetical protein